MMLNYFHLVKMQDNSYKLFTGHNCYYTIHDLLITDLGFVSPKEAEEIFQETCKSYQVKQTIKTFDNDSQKEIPPLSRKDYEEYLFKDSSIYLDNKKPAC